MTSITSPTIDLLDFAGKVLETRPRVWIDGLLLPLLLLCSKLSEGFLVNINEKKN